MFATESFAKSSAAMAAVADEYETFAILLPIRMVVVVRPISANAVCTIFAFRPPSRARCRIRSRLTERKPVSVPEKKAENTGKTENKRKNPLFVIYIFGLLAMSALLYIIALSDMDIVYWAAGTVFLLAGIISAVLYFKNPRIETKSPLYLAASIIFFAAAVVGFCMVSNLGFIMGTGNLLISVILFIIWAKQ